MPYRTGTIPKKLRGKGIPQNFVDQWIEVFNSYLRENSGDEAGAFRRAYAVMTRSLRKAGYRQNSKGAWTKITTKEAGAPDSVQLSMERANLRVIGEAKTLAEATSMGLKLRGVALIDHAVSQQGSWSERYYSPEFNDFCTTRSMERIEQGFPCTTYITHGAALGDMFSGPEKLPVGKIERFERVDDRIEYEMTIAPTAEGLDVMTLFFNDVLGPTSVRIYDVASATRRLSVDEEDPEEPIEEMLAGYIGGIDFCDAPGIPGAGAFDVLESAPVWQEADEMDLESLTLEELQERRPDLLEEHAASVAEALAGTPKAPTAPVEDQTELVATLQQKTEVLEAQVADLSFSLEIAEAAQIGVGREIAKRLRAQVSSSEELTATLPRIRAEALNSVMASLQQPTRTEGRKHVGRDEDTPEPEEGDTAPEISEFQATVLANAR